MNREQAYQEWREHYLSDTVHVAAQLPSHEAWDAGYNAALTLAAELAAALEHANKELRLGNVAEHSGEQRQNTMAMIAIEIAEDALAHYRAATQQEAPTP